jgi:hypothetical protein
MVLFMSDISLKIMLPIRNKDPPLSEIGLPFADPYFTAFWLLFSFLIYAALQIIISTNSHTRHIKLTECHEALMVYNYINNKKWLLT